MDLSSGTLLQGGKYKIIRFIASGGFGRTYEAQHVMLGKRIAIKEFFIEDFCIRDNETTQISVVSNTKSALVYKLKKKFIEEASAIASMSHPNIVSVSDVFEENGTAYYVMDYIEGKSLQQIIREHGALPEDESVKYITAISRALEYIHSLNRLHLDIKPGNIMLKKDGTAILIDFGVSKQYDEIDGENTSTLLGYSPNYAPIEQMSGRIQNFTPSTDIYALGATLYTLLTGHVPPSASDRVGNDNIVPLPSSISTEIRNAVKLAMKVTKEDRLQNITDFLQLIDIKSTSSSSGSNNIELQYNKAIQYIEQDQKELGVSILSHLAEQGYAQAQNDMGDYYRNGHGGITDYDEAIKWYLMAAKQGFVNAQYNLGATYYEKEEFKQSIVWWTKAAEQGDAYSQYALGVMIINGTGVEDNLYKLKTAVEWLQKALNNGIEKKEINELAHSLYLAGLEYDQNGAFGVHLQAMLCWEAAAELGNASAQYQLGVYHEKLNEPEKAKYWITKAAEQGNSLAKDYLGIEKIPKLGYKENKESGCLSIIISVVSLTTMLCTLAVFMING